MGFTRLVEWDGTYFAFFSLAYWGPAFVLLSLVGETLSRLCKGKGGVGRILYVSVSRHEPYARGLYPQT